MRPSRIESSASASGDAFVPSLPEISVPACTGIASSSIRAGFTAIDLFAAPCFSKVRNS